MPALLINVVNGNWVVEVANTNVSYAFAGDNLAAQATNVQGFAETMAADNPDVGFFLDAWGVDEDVLAQQLFADTDLISYAGNLVYSAIGEETIIDDLIDAGTMLLAAL
jgi:hypothetical protein